QVSGGVVTDLSHLLSELLDNATQFSPPADRVRVTGLFDSEGYLLTISDHGVGMTDVRLGEINQLLAKPPVLGLALDPTLGLYVVARLAARHGIEIRLVRGVPGITVRVTIPRNKLEVSTEQPQVDGPVKDDYATVPGESRHVTMGRENGGVVTAERRRVHQRTPSTHDRDATNERPLSAPPVRAVVTGYTGNDVESAPATPLPVQLASNRLSLAEPPPAPRQATAPLPPRPAPVAEPRPQTSAGLPTRIPGTSFNESPVHSPSSVRSEMSPDGIKGALSAFQSARAIGDPDGSEPGRSNPDGKHTDPSTRGTPEDGTS
ncbi:MAG TPA: ATP-binding protein, partial [Acidimicrobiia bacterium]|nr:ATP-binding protein [Acidimicrobiia bacterium]